MLPNNAIKSLLDEITKQDFFSLKENYTECLITDASTEILTINLHGNQEKKVIVYGGHRGDFEDIKRFRGISNKIREITQLKDWIRESAQERDGKYNL